MLSLIIDKSLKDSKLKDNIIRLSFFAFHGFVGAILLNDVIKLLYGEFPYKEKIGYVLGTGIAAAPLLSPEFQLMKKGTNNLALGLGLFVGTLVSNSTMIEKEKKQEGGEGGGDHAKEGDEGMKKEDKESETQKRQKHYQELRKKAKQLKKMKDEVMPIEEQNKEHYKHKKIGGVLYGW